MRRNLLFLVVIGLAGCATIDLPTNVENPIATVAAAEERGADDNPQARLHLKMAEDGIAQAEELSKDDDERGAKLALMRAGADADLALALLRRDDAQKKVQEVRARIEELKADMEKTTK